MPESTHQASGDHPVSSADTRVILRNRAMRTETLLRMKALWLHLTTLVERLGQGPVPLAMNYPVEEAIVLKVIRLENFAANCDNVDRPSEVSLRYQARGHAPLKILPPTSDTYFELRHRLFDHRLEFTSGIAATVSKITLQPVVPVEILFYLDPEDGSIRLSLRNFESLGLREYRVSSHEMNQTAYMVMRYESGSSLEQMLPANATLEESWVKRMVFPIIDGLSLVHESGFIHRDIKPGNLFIREDSSPVLIDFGSARKAMGHATQTLTTIVSPGYAPFEQYHAKSDRQGPWTDVYGLGATLYRAVTGVMPTDALDRSESLLSAGEDSYVPVANLARERYDPAFLDAIDHALAFREADRPRSLSDWACELQGERPGNPAIPSRAPAAKPVSMGVPNGVTDRRRDRHASRYLRRIAVLGSAAVLAVVIGLSLKPTNFDSNASDPVAGLISHEDEVYELADEFGAEETPAWEDEPIDEADEPGETTLEDYEPVEVVWGPPDLGENLMAAWDGLSEMRLSGNNGDNVVALYREVLREDPGNREALIGLQTVFDYHVTRSRDAVRAGDFETAREIMQEALQAAPDREARAFARRRLARLLQHLG